MVGKKDPVKYHPDPLKSCPMIHLHTECPEGYVQWHNWAEKKIKTHRQIRCPGCNRLAIWEKR